MAVPRYAGNTPVAELKAGLMGEGAIIIERLLSEAQVAVLAGQLRPHLEPDRYDGALTDFGLKTPGTLRAQGIIAKAPAIAEILLWPQLLGLAEAVLSHETTVWSGTVSHRVRSTVQLSDTIALSIQPGECAQPLHRDDTTYHVVHPAPENQLLFMIALNTFTADNGGTKIVLGSHRWDDTRGPEESEAIAVEMERGSCVVWLGSTYHGGGANLSDNERCGLALVYCHAYLRQVENQYLAVPVAVAQTLPLELQKLIGYSLSEPLLGFWELGDPIGYLREG